MLSRVPFTDTNDSYDGRVKEGTFFTPLRIFRFLFATLLVKWLLHVFNHIEITRLLLNELYHHYRSSHRRCSMKKAFLPNFVIFAGKHLCRSLFLIYWNYIKKRLKHRCFSVNIAKLLRTSFSKNICQGLFGTYLVFETFHSFNIENWKCLYFLHVNINGAIFYEHGDRQRSFYFSFRYFC